jgi:hypothetical protein
MTVSMLPTILISRMNSIKMPEKIRFFHIFIESRKVCYSHCEFLLHCILSFDDYWIFEIIHLANISNVDIVPHLYFFIRINCLDNNTPRYLHFLRPQISSVLP